MAAPEEGEDQRRTNEETGNMVGAGALKLTLLEIVYICNTLRV